MKLYFYGLAILYLFSLLNRALAIWMGVPEVILVAYLADAVLLGLCLRVSYGAAFNKRYFQPDAIRLIYWGTMTLGFISVGLLTLGEYVGLPDMDIHPVNVIMGFLPYPMFALPCILLERAIREDEDVSRG